MHTNHTLGSGNAYNDIRYRIHWECNGQASAVARMYLNDFSIKNFGTTQNKMHDMKYHCQ